MKKFFVKLLKVQNLLLFVAGIYLLEFISHLIEGVENAHSLGLHFISCMTALALWYTVKSSDSLMDRYTAIIKSQDQVIESLERMYQLRTEMYDKVKERNAALDTFAKDVTKIINNEADKNTRK